MVCGGLKASILLHGTFLVFFFFFLVGGVKDSRFGFVWLILKVFVGFVCFFVFIAFFCYAV